MLWRGYWKSCRNRNVIRTYNSPIGDYAEWIVADKLGLDLNQSSHTGCDAVGLDGNAISNQGTMAAYA